MIKPNEIWENRAGKKVLIKRYGLADVNYVHDGTHYYHHETGQCVSRSPSDGNQRDLWKFVGPFRT